jgi:plastocyanin
MKIRVIPTLFALALVSAVGCSSSAEPGVVSMTDGSQFNPQEITVQAGETVTWRNTSSVAHTVTAYSDSVPPDLYFSSGRAPSEEQARDRIADELIQPDETFRSTFKETGTYEYFCIPHESSGMTGTVVVE